MTVRADSMSLRTLKEQKEYIKSFEYQEALNYLENKDVQIKREKRKEQIKKCNSERYRLEKKIREFTFIEGDISSDFQPIKNDRIPKIILTKLGKIIFKNTK